MTQSRGLLVLLAGAPGAGKSTFARRNFPRDSIVNLDRLRGWVSGDPGNQEATPWAVQAMEAVVHGRLYFRLTTVLDATNADQGRREEWGRHAAGFGCDMAVVILDTPLEKCLAQNAKRRGTRRVPENVVRDMHVRIRTEMPVESTWSPAAAGFGVWIGPYGMRVGGFVPRQHRDVKWLDPARKPGHSTEYGSCFWPSNFDRFGRGDTEPTPAEVGHR
jgi:predicted kinase